MSRLGELIATLKAASEPTRLRMLALLAEGELSVKEVTDILGQSQPRVSRHLRLLADAGLAERHAEGAWAYYRLSDNASSGALARAMLGRLDRDDPMIANDRAKLEAIRAAHASRAAAYFATIAERWDAVRGMHVPETEIEAAIYAIAQRRKLDRVIDLGTGTGRMLELLAPLYRHGLGIDSSREMIAVARAKLSAADVGHAQVRQADIADPIEAGEGADFVVLHQVLHYIEEPSAVLVNAARALKPGGWVLVVDFAPHAHETLRSDHAHRRLGLSTAQMEVWGHAAGLDIVETREFANHKSPDGLTVCLHLLALRNARQQEAK
ncbi:MAG: metalloregulator ArsR/SmtB family transcription factor [Alphaproteobacteria bacterium]|nr:metalloregulator ArsR/SmtB family transcription factor [Alphaproteobacteria bacterium]